MRPLYGYRENDEYIIWENDDYSTATILCTQQPREHFYQLTAEGGYGLEEERYVALLNFVNEPWDAELYIEEVNYEALEEDDTTPFLVGIRDVRRNNRIIVHPQWISRELLDALVGRARDIYKVPEDPTQYEII